MGNILHDWNLSVKKMLIKKAYDCLEPNGAFIIIEDIIDTERKARVPVLLISLNMLLETDEGFNFSE